MNRGWQARWTFVLSVFVLITGAAAQASITAPALTECAAATISWVGVAPFHVWIVDSSDQNGSPLEDFGTMNATSMYWSVNIASGKSVMFAMQDETGDTVFSGTQVINAGSCGGSSAVQSKSTSAVEPAATSSTSTQLAVSSAPVTTTSTSQSPPQASTAAPSTSSKLSTEPSPSSPPSSTSTTTSSSQSSSSGSLLGAGVLPANSSAVSSLISTTSIDPSLIPGSKTSSSPVDTTSNRVSETSSPSTSSTQPVGTPNTGANNLPQDAQSSGSKSSGLSSGAKIGVIVGGVFGLLGATFTGYLIYRAIRHRNEDDWNHPFREVDDIEPYPSDDWGSQEKQTRRPASLASLSEWLRGPQDPPPTMRPRPPSTSSSFESGSPGVFSYHQPPELARAAQGYRPSSTLYGPASAHSHASQRERGSALPSSNLTRQGSDRDRETATALPSSDLTRPASGAVSDALPSSTLSRSTTLNTQRSVYVDVVKRDPLEPGFLQLPPTSYRPARRGREEARGSALSPIPSSAALLSSYLPYSATESARDIPQIRSSQVLPTADTGTFSLPFVDANHTPWMSAFTRSRQSPEDAVSNGGFPYEHDTRTGSTSAQISRASRIRMSTAMGRRQTIVPDQEGSAPVGNSPGKSEQSSARERKEWASGVPRSARTMRTERLDQW